MKMVVPVLSYPVFLLFVYVTQLDVTDAVLKNVALNKPITTSSLFDVPSWANLTNMVDGDLRTDGNTCECCVATSGELTPWVTVDLGKEYWISRIVIYGRTDDTCHITQSFSGTKLYLSNTSDIEVRGNAFYTVRQQASSPCCHWNGFVNITVEEAIKGRFMTLLKNGTYERLIVICELQVFGSECIPGTYGDNCDLKCGHCFNDEPCDSLTGVCDRCAAGYKGSTCQTECTPGTYGSNCERDCGNCYNNGTCDGTTGVCDRCAAGYRGPACNTECIETMYGENCTHQCHCFDNKSCDPVSGHCDDSGCAEGFYSENCQIKLPECTPGTYGMNCNQSCGHCYGNKPCNQYTGVCEQCEPGYSGTTCQAECTPGTYGHDCSRLCAFCKEYEPCDHVTGECSRGCAAGRQGNLCEQRCELGTFGENCSQTCHCIDKTSCNPYTGGCGNSACIDGFIGFNCQSHKYESVFETECPTDDSNILIVLIGVDCTCLHFDCYGSNRFETTAY